MRPVNFLIISALAMPGCSNDPMQRVKDANHHLYVERPRTEECNPTQPCNMWQPDFFGSECVVSNDVSHLAPGIMARLRVCAEIDFPRSTDNPENDLCLRSRTIEGWLRKNMFLEPINRAPALDNQADMMKKPEYIIKVALDTANECERNMDR